MAALAAQADGEQAAGDGDREQEDGVEEDEEGQQRARGVLGLHAGLAERPEREGDAAGATRREQTGDRGAGQRDLGARAQVHPVSGSLADHPQQCDVAGERDHFEADGGEDPARVSLERPAQRVAEGVHRAAGEDQHPGQHHQRGRRAARHGARGRGRRTQGGRARLGRRRGAWVQSSIRTWLRFSGGIRWRCTGSTPRPARRPQPPCRIEFEELRPAPPAHVATGSLAARAATRRCTSPGRPGPSGAARLPVLRSRRAAARLPLARRADAARARAGPDQPAGMTQPAIATKWAMAAAITNAWKISWKPKMGGHGFGRRVA